MKKYTRTRESQSIKGLTLKFLVHVPEKAKEGEGIVSIETIKNEQKAEVGRIYFLRSGGWPDLLIVVNTQNSHTKKTREQGRLPKSKSKTRHLGLIIIW